MGAGDDVLAFVLIYPNDPPWRADDITSITDFTRIVWTVNLAGEARINEGPTSAQKEHALSVEHAAIRKAVRTAARKTRHIRNTHLSRRAKRKAILKVKEKVAASAKKARLKYSRAMDAVVVKSELVDTPFSGSRTI
jgi:hypothetical protein